MLPTNEPAAVLVWALEYVPAPQNAHAMAPADEKVPAFTQNSVTLDWPVEGQKLPAGQATQAEEPLTAENVPKAQLEQITLRPA